MAGVAGEISGHDERVPSSSRRFEDATPLGLVANPDILQAARKKLESRRLAFDASITKLQKSKRDDFRLEEELRSAKAKYEESSEDVLRRMQDIQEAEADSVRDLTHFLDAELDYHERCVEELRRARQNWPGASSAAAMGYGGLERRPTGRSRANTAQSCAERPPRASVHGGPDSADVESIAPPVRMPTRASICRMPSQPAQTDGPLRPTIGRPVSFQGGASLERERIGGGRASGAGTPSTASHAAANHGIPDVSALRSQLRPVSRILAARDETATDREDDTASDAGSPDWSNRSTSSATSAGSLCRTPSSAAANGNGLGLRKAPPPPPPSRSKKPPLPPVPARREVGY